MTRIARAARKQGYLRAGVTVEEANDILWVITSFESFDLLYDGRGLPLDTVVERLTETAERALLDPLSGGGAGSVLGHELAGGEGRALRVADDRQPDPRHVERAGDDLAAELLGLPATSSALSTPKVMPQCGGRRSSAVLRLATTLSKSSGAAHLRHALAVPGLTSSRWSP